MILEIIYQDENYIAINKPAGVMVHKTPLEKDPETLFAVQLLRDQIGQWVYPLHRIDRPTSGILLFAKSSEATALLQPQFAGTSIKKYYLAIVRGFLPELHGQIDRPLSRDLTFEAQAAQTEYWHLASVEIPFASSKKYPSSRYALVKVAPHTGRMHQIRRHFAQIRHYVIGDSTHGDNKQNKFFRNQFGLKNLMLHAWKLEFSHPLSGLDIKIQADLPDYFIHALEKLRLRPESWES